MGSADRSPWSFGIPRGPDHTAAQRNTNRPNPRCESELGDLAPWPVLVRQWLLGTDAWPANRMHIGGARPAPAGRVGGLAETRARPQANCDPESLASVPVPHVPGRASYPVSKRAR